MNYLLGTDIGTSGTKTILTDLKGNVIAQDLQETDILTPHPLWAEQWPDVWLNAVKVSVQNTVAKAGVKAEANMGDVMLAGIGTGLLTYEEVKTWQVLDEPLMPDPARHAQYDRCFEVYKSIYRHLKDDMKALSALS